MEVRKSSWTTSLDYSWCWVWHPYRLPVGIWIARHTYLGAHRRCHSRWGVLFWSSCLRRMRREGLRRTLPSCPTCCAGIERGHARNSHYSRVRLRGDCCSVMVGLSLTDRSWCALGAEQADNPPRRILPDKDRTLCRTRTELCCTVCSPL